MDAMDASGLVPPSKPSPASAPATAERGNAWWRLFRLALPDWSFLLLAAFGAATSGAINPLFGLIFTTVRWGMGWGSMCKLEFHLISKPWRFFGLISAPLP